MNVEPLKRNLKEPSSQQSKTRFGGIIFAVIVVVAFALNGCAERWKKPGATAQDFETMKSSCVNRSATRFPPKLQQTQVSGSYSTSTETVCNHGSCYQSGGQFMPPTTKMIDENQKARDQDTKNCYLENGWQLEK